jgi:hypothetical protein
MHQVAVVIDDPQRLVDAAEIVIHVVQRDGQGVIFDLL